MIILPVYINSKGPFNFILDTGVGLMVITDPTLVDSLDINFKRTIKLLGYGNQNGLEAYVTSPLNVVIQNLCSNGVGAAIFKQDHFGLSSYAGMPIHGLLGYEFFSQLAIKISFTDSTLTITQPGKIKPFKKGLKLHLNVEDRKPYLTTAVTLADGQRIEQKIIVDLGAGHSLSLERARPSSCFQSIEANLGFGLTGPVTGSMSRIDAIELGNYRLNNVITAFPDSCKANSLIVKRDGNLGMDVLKRFTLIFDYTNNALYLKRNSHFKEPFEHDMSGLEYYAAGNNLKRIIISRVEPGSAGAAIGLVKDDEITAVNFKPINQMSIVDLDNLFKSRNDRNIIIEVMHDKKYEVKILTLKRRI
ncbi:aspartyl protease family protein [Mucilaginibacter lacusdianchii]|uniref:aspartyl protease family protein n=1 Tax=Mucilaginibacter lacusdianchii TaxID=2684211 RepID=UPI00131CFD3E|nr:aspartyl protease family protein [Mucilaginibacter sp. JXJ CY 39]